MREIKFRAWDKARKSMSPASTLAGWMADAYSQAAEFAAENADEIEKYFGLLQFMQFTGLKDKNGKEIYEADIVRVSYDGSLEFVASDAEVREVIRGAKDDEYYPAFDLKGHDMEINALSCAKNKGDIEVIGNIYENPEFST